MYHLEQIQLETNRIKVDCTQVLVITILVNVFLSI